MSDIIPGCRERTNFISMREKYGQNVVTRLRKLINMKIRIAKYRSHLYFNHRCKDNKVLPFSLRFKPPIRSKKGYKLMVNAGFSFLRLRINDCHQSIQRLRSDWQRLFGELSALIDCSEIQWIEEFCRSEERKESFKQREKHDRKLLRLIGKKPSDKSDTGLKQRWIKNLSSKELSELERKGLQHGLKFAVVPNRIPTAEIIASVEEGIFQLDDDDKRLVRAEVSSILRRAKLPPKNMDSNVFKALLALRKDPARIILSADKGNCVVVMDKIEYREKALSLLSDKNTYTVLKSDPTGKTQRDLNAKLLLLKKSNIISETTYKMLYSSDGLSPRFYGLPKIHKPEIPLRPIVSFVNSPTYGVSSFLAKILSPVVGNTENTVKNSYHFAEFIRGKTLNADEVLVSFDVISLFTKIPVDLAIKVARKRLRQDVTLSQRTSMPIEDIIDLLSFCLNTTYFVFDGIYYQQVFGTAMGSPVSAVIASLVMEDVEQRALASAPVRLSFWKRFVDDIISAVSRNDIDILLQHLNSIEPSIQFTVERETNGHLAFLDLNVYRTIEGKLETAVYRKPTHTDKYLSYNSHHPVSHKKSVAKTLLQRAEHLPSNSDSQANEREYVLNILRENNYPKDFLKNCLNPSACRNQNNSEGDTSIKGYAVVPYIQGVTEPIKRILSNCNIKVALKPYLTLGHIFAKPKDPIPTNQKTHAVYSIPCNDCEKEYLGQSKRQFGTRLKEHQKAVSTLNKGKSALAEHVCDTKHAIAWENSKIITTNNRYGQRRCLEAWHINMNQHALNRDDGSYLPQEYLHLVGK